MLDKISIIVPIYNGEKYLESCIKSILNQSYENFELILLNDGSTDNSEEICKFYQAQDSRIKYYSFSNQGVSKTREKGLSLSSGDYVTFVDCDDKLKKDFLETLYISMIKNKTEIVCCNSTDVKNQKIGIEINKTISNSNEWLKDFFNEKRYMYCIWSKLYKKSLLMDIEFPNMKYAEDTFVVFNVFNKNPKIQLLSYDGYYYRYNENGAMNLSSGLQQPLCVYKLNEFVLKVSKLKYSNYINDATKKLLNSIFILIVVGCKGDEKDWCEIKTLINEKLNEIAIKYYFKNFKSLFVLCYRLFPNFIRTLLKQYYKIKRRK